MMYLCMHRRVCALFENSLISYVRSNGLLCDYFILVVMRTLILQKRKDTSNKLGFPPTSFMGRVGTIPAHM